ncbi:MAG: serine/threonine protein kinase [Actinomycetota bacterium]|nr:serine/threonine protein kinase [Actinomycetota bacterium]
MNDRAGWAFEMGQEIVPGRVALKKLGGGKRYEVYLAWDERLRSQVVVKLVRPDQVDDPRSIRDLERELQALDRLAHPMLVHLLGALVEGERPHLVLEHLEGPTLRALIKSGGPLQMDRLVPLAIEAGEALRHISAKAMVHLDVKPSNIVMQSPPKLIDLSLTRSVEVAASIKRPVGTRKYMSPEQCVPTRLGPVGPPADVWGLGATLYEAAAGRRAFDTPARGKVPDEAPDSVKYPQLVLDPPPLPASVPPTVAELIRSCLEREPEARPGAGDVTVRLRPLLGGQRHGGR